ncbi:MAG: hypothetical protein GXO93_03270 [FCB group bacterium]|nr:hypothetical protein [FCB group bacterium]
MYRVKIFVLLSLLSVIFLGSSKSSNTAIKLKEWQKGVWIQPDGSYTIYTDTHYFVVSLNGDSSHTNIYCGASQIEYHNKGMARKQVLRIRKFPQGNLTFYKNSVFQSDKTEKKLTIDSTLFSPGKCNIVDGIIYDAITEETDNYILLSTCNGDKEKIFSNGVSVYLPASGGEFYSYRVEKL